MSFGKMPMANSFLDRNDFSKEFFYELEVGFSESNFLFQVNDHQNQTKYLIIDIRFILINQYIWLIILKIF